MGCFFNTGPFFFPWFFLFPLALMLLCLGFVFHMRRRPHALPSCWRQPEQEEIMQELCRLRQEVEALRDKALPGGK